MASQNHTYLDLKLVTNKKIEGTTLVVDWFADASKSAVSVAPPSDPIDTGSSAVSFHQGFELLV
jgi:hypothetical protein